MFPGRICPSEVDSLCTTAQQRDENRVELALRCGHNCANSGLGEREVGDARQRRRRVEDLELRAGSPPRRSTTSRVSAGTGSRSRRRPRHRGGPPRARSAAATRWSAARPGKVPILPCASAPRGRRRSAPSPEQGASTSTRSNTPSGPGLLGAVGHHDLRCPGPGSDSPGPVRRPTSAARCGCSLGGRSGWLVTRPGQAAEQAGLAAGACAQVEPEFGVGCAGGFCGQRGAGGGVMAASWLASSWTATWPAAIWPGAMSSAGLPESSVKAYGDQLAGSAPGGHHLVAVQAAGEGGHGDLEGGRRPRPAPPRARPRRRRGSDGRRARAAR